MNREAINSILIIGETVAVEFKRCGNGIESDTYETVCSFISLRKRKFTPMPNSAICV